MTETSLNNTTLFVNNATTITIESWFIPLDILMIVCAALIIILTIIFLFTIILDKTCHTVSMMLTANSCLAAFVSACILLALYAFTLENDLKQIQFYDSLCIFRGYLATVSGALLLCSFLLQAIYRYNYVVYPNRLFWRSARFQILFICLTWIFAFGFCIAFIFTGDIVYNVDNQICLIPLRFSFPIIFTTLSIYIIPVSMIMSLYMKLFRYVKEMSDRITPVDTLSRARRQLKMARHTVILVTTLNIIGFPYAFFMFLSFFNLAPIYHFRIAFVFIGTSFLMTIIILFYFNEPLKASLIKRIKRQPNIIHIANPT